MKVLGRITSINVRKVLWALEELGQSYEQQDWGLPLRDPKEPDFLALNPNGQIPVLVDGEFSMWESNAILIYLAEKYRDGALLPDDLQARARAFQWLGWQVSDLNPAWMYAIHALVRKSPGYDDPARTADSVARWSSKMDVLEAQLATGQGFVAGSQFSIADIAIGLSLHRWFCLPTEKKAMPASLAYYERLKLRPAANQWFSDKTP